MAPRQPHRKRRNSRTPSQGPRTPSPESTTTGSSLHQTPWSFDFEDQDATSRSSTRSPKSSSFDTASSSNTSWPSSGSSNPSMADIETFEMNVEDSSASLLNDADASTSGINAQMPADRAKPEDKTDDQGYVLETILLNHLKFLWGCLRFIASYWKAIGSLLLTIILVAIYFGIQYFDECNAFLAQNDLPVMPTLEDLNTMVGYDLFVYFTAGFIIIILGLAAWCSVDWKRMVSTETRRFVSFCLAQLKNFGSWILRGISSLLHTLVIDPLTAFFWRVVSIPRAVVSWFLSLIMWSINKGDEICRRRFLFILAMIGLFAHWLWGRAYPLNPVEQLAAFAARHRGNDILAFCIFQISYYVAYYYFSWVQYFFPAKYEYNIWDDQVVQFIACLVLVIAGLALVIGKIFDIVMRDTEDVKKMQDI
ncbi:uncharacterized protein FTJAE_10895 [Fusarium tjaetaba]|uniref:Uncharacterized protein n=1 Tax=Fusarium tjaetaba TaxID=1567544 RepID=A0A8H5VFE7_9HYPO|nr:uncharacterized protein FTJAE_10895 [Fusarium tjaetaba]KAF5622577.1 hypothetical protein FTJAE_10895 [Fusarium tjaetaba]